MVFCSPSFLFCRKRASFVDSWASINCVHCSSFSTSNSPHPSYIHSVFLGANFCFFIIVLHLQIYSAYSAFALCSAWLCFGVERTMEAVATEAASSIISQVCKVVIAPLLQLIKDVVHLGRNTLLLQEKLTTARARLQDTDNAFQDQQRSAPASVTDALEKLRRSIRDAEGIINRSLQRQGCLDRSFCKPMLCRQIRKYYTVIDNCCNNLRSAISSVRDTREVALSAPLEAEALLQTVPESGFVGRGIRSAEKQLNGWLEDADQDHQFRVIGVFGMGGIGKTSLLKTVYNTHRKGNVFEKVIWLTVSQKFDIQDLQKIIAEKNSLDLGIGSSNAESSSAVLEMRRMKLFNYLKEKKFLLILDDVWDPIQLKEELGIPLGNNKGSRVVISTRDREVIGTMEANDYSIQMEPLSLEEGWKLFGRVAFNAGPAPTKIVEDIARKIADECKGLPLAINVVAAAMRGNTCNADEWNFALSQMKNVDPGFLKMYGGIDKHLIQPLKLSYDRLNDRNLQNCFLYCGAFAEDERIEVDRLVEMWIGEGLVSSRDKSQLMEAGRRYVKLLVERGLFEPIDSIRDTRWLTGRQKEYLKVHDILRDMALHIAEKEEKCLFRTSQKLDQFPAEQVMDDCKRIAIHYYNDDRTAFLPTDFRCPTLGTLILTRNHGLREVPNGFLLHLPSLRVLNLSDTNITSLPESMWQLRQLEFLGLDSTKITTLPADIRNLSRLQFLHLSYCRELKSLPCTIGELKNLKHLYLHHSNNLAGIPSGISQLTSLNKLGFDTGFARLFWQLNIPGRAVLGVDEDESGMCSLKDFKNFPNLMELTVYVKPGKIVDGKRSGIKMGPMGTWLQMKHLVLGFDFATKVMEDLPPDMRNMKNLQTFVLFRYSGVSLPNCICDFERLEELSLVRCGQLEELPPLERLPNLSVLRILDLRKVRELGISGRVGGFPMLNRLELQEMRVLESISTSSSSNAVVWTEDTMPNLQFLMIKDCNSLKRLPIGIEKLSNLRNIEINKDVWVRSIQADHNIKISREEKIKFL